MAQLINDLKVLLLKNEIRNTEKEKNETKTNFNENIQHKKHLSLKIDNIIQVQNNIDEKQDKSHTRNFSVCLNSPKNKFINKENVGNIRKNVRSNTICLYESDQFNDKQIFTNQEIVVKKCLDTNILAPLSKDFISDHRESELKSQIEMIARQRNILQNSFYPSKEKI